MRLSEILNLVGGIRPGAAFVATISADEYTTALPMELAMSPEAMLVYEMNGQVLPREHGYPARMLVPGRYGMKNAKWVVALRPMRREFVDWYGQRSWSREAMVKTMTRIDVPARGARIPAGTQRIAGHRLRRRLAASTRSSIQLRRRRHLADRASSSSQPSGQRRLGALGGQLHGRPRARRSR